MKNSKILVISNYTLTGLKGFFSRHSIQVDFAPFGDIFGQLHNYNEFYKDQEYDFVLVWINPLTTFEFPHKDYESLAELQHDIEEELTYFSGLLENPLPSAKSVMVVEFSLLKKDNTFSVSNWDPLNGSKARLNRVNQELAKKLSKSKEIFQLDSSGWGLHENFNSKLWYAGKIPFSNQSLEAASNDIALAIKTVLGKSAKLLLLDLDNTLWGGVVGDDGYKNIRLGGIDPIGEAHQDFQKQIKQLKNKGVILGLVSKNTESIAMDAIENHPEMILRKEDFVCWRINWQDKATNIREIIEEINIGDDAVVFIDDSPTEREWVRTALPEVLVPDFPVSPLDLTGLIDEIKAFDNIGITGEDKRKTELYKAEFQRKKSQQSNGDITDWIKGLQIQITLEEYNSDNCKRIIQLVNKTNQFNLNKRSLTESEFESDSDSHLFGVRVKDKFGDYGLVGVIGLRPNGEKVIVEDFILSCRVLGRAIEKSLMSIAIEIGMRLFNARELVFNLKETDRNIPCIKSFQESVIEEVSPHKFVWNCNDKFETGELHELDFGKGLKTVYD